MLRLALGDLVEQLSHAGSAAALYEAATACLFRSGFNSLLLSAEAETLDLAATPPTIARWPEGSWETYLREGHDSRNYIHVRFAASPNGASWRSDEAVADREHERFLGYLNDFGVRSGVVAPVIAGAGRKRIIVATLDRRETVDPALAAYVAAAGNLIAMAEMKLRAAAPQDSALRRLSGRQLEILRWVSRGKSNADIAVITGLSVRTVNFHMSEILRKLGVGSRTQAASLLIQHAPADESLGRNDGPVVG